MLSARFRNALAVSGVALGMLGVTLSSTTSAAAADKAYAWTQATSWGAKANDGEGYFQPDGEIFGLRDNRKDGLGVVLEWWIHGSSAGGQLWDTDGYSTSFKTFDKSFAEGSVVEFHVCLEDGGVIEADTCGAHAVVVA